MTRRTWFRTLTGAFATLATGLGLRKVEKKYQLKPYIDLELDNPSFHIATCMAVYGDGKWTWVELDPETLERKQ